VKRQCISRMACWVNLLLCSINAEFPSWHVLQAFRTLDLQHTLEPQGPHLKDLERLAAVFRVDSVALKHQFNDLRPSARRTRTAEGLNNQEAWRSALRKAKAKHMRTLHPTGALQPVLVRYVTLSGATTSGVERLFSVQKSLLGIAGRGGSHQSLSLENDELIILSSITNGTLKGDIMQAMQIYKEIYGRPKPSGKRRSMHLASKRCAPREDP